MVLLLLLMFWIFPKNALALDFIRQETIVYNFDLNGQASISHQIGLKNKMSRVYPTQYQMSISSTNIKNISASDQQGNIIKQINNQSNSTTISVVFNQPAVGKDQSTNFNLSYTIENLAKKKGNTWEISLPQTVSQEEDQIEIILNLPPEYGILSFNSVPIHQVDYFNNQTKLNIINQNDQKILLIFGTHQIFDFDLTYFLENKTESSTLQSIPIPPDTHHQSIVYKSFDPPFHNINIDSDGNWLAEYLIEPNQQIKINVTGQAKISAQSNATDPLPNYQLLTQNQPYWPVSDPNIKKIASTLNSPKEIYHYVIENLNYDYNQLSNATRKGALEALISPNNSLCTEFTDLFVTISRAKGIPAREVEGFAYTNNPKIKPINPDTDILHAWPQYYLKSQRRWVDIDPTWGETTNGVDYFNDLDLNHITFVIHGSDSAKPLPPGSYKGGKSIKTVKVDYAQTPLAQSDLPPQISLKQNRPFQKTQLSIFNPNLHSIKTEINQTSYTLLPLQQIYIDHPKITFFRSILPSNRYFKIDVDGQTIKIASPWFFLNLGILTITTITVLCLGGIILMKHKS